jgi:hypothetical protein
MKSGEREAYLPSSGNQRHNNNGSGHDGFPLLMFFPSAFFYYYSLVLLVSLNVYLVLELDDEDDGEDVLIGQS